MTDARQQHRLFLIASLFAALMLVGTLGSGWPYSYFILLRWVVCAAGSFAAFVAYSWRHTLSVLGFVGIAILFNPLAPVYLSRREWRPIDLGVATVFLIGSAVLRPVRPVAASGT